MIHGMMRAMCQSTKSEMRMSGKGKEISPVGLGGGEKQKEENREKGRKEGEKEKGKERKEDSTASSSNFRHSDDRSSSS